MKIRTMVVLAAVLVAGLATGVGGAYRATAATPPPTLTGVVRAEAASVSNSNTAKSVTVTCPGTKSVINVSGVVDGGGGKVVLDELFPHTNLRKATVTAKETDPTTASWDVRAVVTCADKPSGLELKTALGVDDTTADKTTSAGCSTGKTMLGTGMDIIGGQGEVGAYRIAPVVDAAGRPFSVDVSAAVLDPADLTTSWHVNAFSICADPLTGHQLITADAAPSTLGSSSLTVYCPFGTVASGTGYEVINGTGEVIVNAVDPGGSTSTAPDRVVPLAFEEDGTSLVWTLRGDVICVAG